MPNEGPWRAIETPSTLDRAWTPLEIRARQREDELLHEAEQNHLARLARATPRSDLDERRSFGKLTHYPSFVLPTLLSAAVSPLVDFARRLVIYRGRGSTSEG